MKKIPYFLPLFVMASCLGHPALILAQSSGALSLLETPSARAASMGEAISALGNDVSAMAYNPAALSTLNKGQVSFSYQRGLNEDTFGQAMMGVPTARFSWGVSLGAYDGGTMTVFDGQKTGSVSAQRDLMLSVGLAEKINKFRVGISLKSLNSQLAESDSARYAVAIDSGFLYRPLLAVQHGVVFAEYGK